MALRGLLARTRPVRPASADAVARRWDGLPGHVKTPGQIIGRRITGCEGTHGVFPACDFSCKPCYHSVDANKVRIDGPHTLAEVERQMVFLEQERGPGSFAQLIGGEVSLLAPHDHARAIEIMRSHGRAPMSLSHGDFDDEYLREVVIGPDGRPRFDVISFAAHIDTTMMGRRGATKPQREDELHGHRAEFCAMFERLKRDFGVRHYLAHNMTVTPSNIDQIADVVRTCRDQGWRMFSFQPAAYVGNQTRWRDGYRSVSNDDVWAAIEAGVGRSLPYKVLQFGDLRCNRVSWGAFVGDRYVPVLEEDDAIDLAARDLFLSMMPGGLLPERNIAVNTIRMVRAVLARPGSIPIAARWARRFVRRAGGVRSLRKGIRPVTFVVHAFIDAADVEPAWNMLQRGETASDPQVRIAQERLLACGYSMAHPETEQLVPACVQHSVLDPEQNRRLAVELPLPTRKKVPA